MQNMIFVLLGGVLGVGLRYVVILTCPVPVLISNLLGAYLMGVASCVLDDFPQLRLMIMTGFLGGLTTFSSVLLETATYWQTSKLSAVLYVMGTFFGGLMLFWLGGRLYHD